MIKNFLMVGGVIAASGLIAFGLWIELTIPIEHAESSEGLPRMMLGAAVVLAGIFIMVLSTAWALQMGPFTPRPTDPR